MGKGEQSELHRPRGAFDPKPGHGHVPDRGLPSGNHQGAALQAGVAPQVGTSPASESAGEGIEKVGGVHVALAWSAVQDQRAPECHGNRNWATLP